MSNIFEGRVAIVTGGGQGIGASICAAFAGEGATIAVVDIAGAQASTVAAAISARGGTARAFAIDVADPAAVDAVCASVANAFGGIDIVINNAGIDISRAVENMSQDDWQRVLDVNLTGPMNFTRASVPYLRRRAGAAIVNVSSLAGKRLAYNGGANYTAAKSGLMGLTRQSALELAAYGIRVNAVCPGPVLTPMMKNVMSQAEIDEVLNLLPLGRWVMPEEVADAVLFFAGPSAAMCTGTDIDVDGGFSVTYGIPFEDYFKRRGVAYEAAEPPPSER
jgi:NAD(P)-dependent dehydrogenase (short-subunit alcohol dehydrogenase family)